ncbi:hypothetical protein N7501_008830 [Penicillium viridicatum]|nr:hypothetical protein N7501_008830 [Penicillium viridicatum]
MPATNNLAYPIIDCRLTGQATLDAATLRCSCCDPGATLMGQRAPLQASLILAAPRPTLVLEEKQGPG